MLLEITVLSFCYWGGAKKFGKILAFEQTPLRPSLLPDFGLFSVKSIVAKGVKISTNQCPPQKISTKNARFTTISNLQQNSVNTF